jgi:hypothetical protein
VDRLNSSLTSIAISGIAFSYSSFSAAWLRLQGVRATLRMPQPYHGSVAIPAGLEGSPFGYRDKDFTQIAVRGLLHILTAPEHT